MVDATEKIGIPYSGLFEINIDGVSASLRNEIVIPSLTMEESLLSGSLETSLVMQAPIYNLPAKNYDDFKGQTIDIMVYNPNIQNGKEFRYRQKIYRQENRAQNNYNLETFTIRACDYTLLSNFAGRISKFYQCENPSTVVQDALNCVGALQTDVEASQPPRDYLAANLYPFQVIAEQADVALNGMDPSFLHYMTYLNGGTHHFRSIKSLTQEPTKWEYIYADKGFGNAIANPHLITSYEFPCDYDLVTDIMNGIDANGQPRASLITVNTFNGIASLINGAINACGGMGETVNTEGETDKYSTEDNCGVHIEDYASVRKARLTLIQPDKIALRLVVPFNPIIHAGDMIDIKFYSKIETQDLNYGSGDYLIVNLKHHIERGGYGVTLLECVSKTVGQGIV